MQIGDVRKMLMKELGLDISDERLRRYEKMGLFESTRSETSNFREFSKEQGEKVKEVVLMIELGVPIKALLENDVEEINKRRSLITSSLEQIRRQQCL